MGNWRSQPPEPDTNGQAQTTILNPRLLNRKEKKTIRKTWNKLGSEQLDFVRNVWLASAERSPRVKQILGLDEEDAKENDRFRRLNKGVRDFFQKLIVDLDLENEAMLEQCYVLGVQHSRFTENVFQPIFWDIFLVSLVDTMEKREYPGVSQSKRWFTIYTWHKFVHLVVNQMIEAYRATRIGDEIDDF